jgi:hypothetical protein
MPAPLREYVREQARLEERSEAAIIRRLVAEAARRQRPGSEAA